MPRQVRQASPRRAAPGRTVFGRRWPLPVSPLATALTAALLVVAGAVWYTEGRFETPPAEAAKQVVPYKAAALQSVQLTTSSGSVTYTRDASGQFSTGGPPPEPTPTPGPEATPAPVVLSPSTRLEGLINQLAGLRVDRVVANEPSASSEYGLDSPQFTLTLAPKQGTAAILAVGQLNPDGTAYYVRRDDRKDTVLVSRYTLDDLMKVAEELVKEGK
jgi:hypothetical protein